MSRRRGFTLIELLVVVALMAVAMGIVGVGVGHGLQAARERQILRDMVYALRQARTRAVFSQSPTALHFDMQQRWYQAPGQARRSWSQNMMVSLATAAEVGSSMAFYPNGSSSGGHLYVQRDGQRWRIDVSWLTGNVRLQALP
jgi:general secretion pathway protein H